MSKKCVSCGAENIDGALFCASCGAKQAEVINSTKFCSKCGVENRADAQFCSSCGASMTVEKKEKSMLPFYAGATVVIAIGMGILTYNMFSEEPSRPSPLVNNITPSPAELNVTEANITEINITKPKPNELVIAKSAILNKTNIKSFLQEYLRVNCFDSKSDVGNYFSNKITKYFDFKNPTHTSIYSENVTYCENRTVWISQLSSFEIKNSKPNSAGNEIDIVAHVNYHLTDDTKDIYNDVTVTMPMTLIDEFGQIKIKSIASTKVKSKTPEKQKNINPKNDDLAPYAYEMITGERLLDINSVKITHNSKSQKIYCVDGVCKTTAEVLEYMRDN